jgi:hypothetical protein
LILSTFFGGEGGVVLGFELRASHWLGRHSITWATSPALFCDGFFQDRVSQITYLSWLWTATILISASWIARIAGIAANT